MKCCKSCKSKKGIRCLGTPKIYKYEGYKFCTECTRPYEVVKERLKSLGRNIEFKKRIKDITSEEIHTKEESHTHIQKIKSQIDIEEITQDRIINKPKIMDKLKQFLSKVVSTFGSKI